MDLNADLGESWYDLTIGDDAGIMPHLSSCNIACGMHGGDALTMQQTIKLAIAHSVNIGAHPSYPDRKHFGRKAHLLSPRRLQAILDYQVAALQGMVHAAGGTLIHLKPHGALYHEAAFGDNLETALAVVRTAKKFGGLTVFGPQDSYLDVMAREMGIPFLAEGFVDRKYKTHNQLVSRSEKNATLSDLDTCKRQAIDLCAGKITLQDGRTVAASVQTLCLHGDHPGAAERARAIREILVH